MYRAVFLDRDGTLGGDGGYCHPDAFQLFPESFEAIRLLNASGLKVVVVTNQTHIGTGEITLAQVEASFRRLQADLASSAAHLDGWYVCPHLPEDHCRCRKPSPYLLEQAAGELDLDLPASYMVGDVGSHDLLAGAAVRCRTILVRTGWGTDSLGRFRHLWASIEPTFIVDNVLEAARWIVRLERDGEGERWSGK